MHFLFFKGIIKFKNEIHFRFVLFEISFEIRRRFLKEVIEIYFLYLQIQNDIENNH